MANDSVASGAKRSGDSGEHPAVKKLHETIERVANDEERQSKRKDMHDRLYRYLRDDDEIPTGRISVV